MLFTFRANSHEQFEMQHSRNTMKYKNASSKIDSSEVVAPSICDETHESHKLWKCVRIQAN